MQRGLVADGNGIVSFYVTFIDDVLFIDALSSGLFVKIDA